MENEIGRFGRWGEAVTIDVVKRVMSFLPEAREGDLVEVPGEDEPSEEALKARVSSF
ncbi:MAG: hypothetical protein ACXVQ6_10265 [Actinomycetota bacterium]